MAAFGKALTAGLDILEQVRACPEGATYGELKSAASVSPASFARFLKLLLQRGYLRQNAGGRYIPGWQLAWHGQAALRTRPLRTLAQPHLQSIVKETNEAAEIVEFDGDHFVILDRFESAQAVQLRAQPGSVFGIGDGNAIGVLAMASADDSHAASLPKSLTRQILSDGYYAMLQNNDTAWRGTAAIRDGTGRIIGCIAIAAPAFRIGEPQLTDFRKVLLRHAEEISASLGTPGEQVIKEKHE